MNRLFRQPAPGIRAYAALGLFAVVWLAAMAIVIAPAGLLGPDRPASAALHD